MLPMTTLDSTLGRYLQLVWDRGASDLHLTAGYPPVLRIDGELVPIEGEQRLMPPDVARMIRSMFTEDHWAVYLEKKQVDFSFGSRASAASVATRTAARRSWRSPCAASPTGITTLEELEGAGGDPHAPRQPYGLVLVRRPDRFRQVDDAGGDDRPDQRDRAGATSSRSRTRSSTSTTTSVAMVNQREVGTDVERRSPTACAARCVRTPTSSSSARCATSTRSRSR